MDFPFPTKIKSESSILAMKNVKIETMKNISFLLNDAALMLKNMNDLANICPEAFDGTEANDISYMLIHIWESFGGEKDEIFK